jgi:phosphocarrier protein
MKEFDFVVKNEEGLHARPAGILSKEAKKYESTITITNEKGKSAVVTKLIAVMALGVKCGQTVNVKVEGPDEDAVFEEVKKFFEENF